MFAVAFGAVILAVGVIPMLSGTGEPGTVGDTTPATSVIVTTTVPAPAECSATGLNPPPDQAGLPTPVSEMRRAIITAALACHFEALEALAPDLRTDFTGGRFENIPMWEEEDMYPALSLIVELFGTPYATQEIEGTTSYVWPSAFVYDTWEEIPEVDLEALLGVYTQEELDNYSGFGSYALWRTAITEHGQWQTFIAGD